MSTQYNARGWFRPILKYARKHVKRFLMDSDFRFLQKLNTQFANTPRFQEGVFTYQGMHVCFNDSASLINMWDEIFVNRIYDIGEINHIPKIIDAGSNIGLAALYFKHRYGNVEGICFEPDPNVYRLLCRNLDAWHIEMQRECKALADTEKKVIFCPDGSDGGRVEEGISFDKKTIIEVQTVCLSNYMSDETIDFLKMDIEGSELQVLQEIREKLDRVRNIFVEVHNFHNRSPLLGQVLSLLENCGFKLVIKESVSPRELYQSKPCGQSGNLDLAINVFGSKA